MSTHSRSFPLSPRTLLLKIFTYLRIVKYRLLSTNNLQGKYFRVSQPVLSLGLGTIKLGNGTRLGYFPSPHFFSTYSHLEARHPDSEIIIGPNTHINNDFVIIAEKSVQIGANCLIGTRCEILDSDFHSLSKEKRDMDIPATSKSVIIHDNVFIGNNVKILKGVRIGAGAVIGNSSLVTKDVPPCSVACGNPARIQRFLNVPFTPHANQ